ncbi:MAG: ATP-dependent DNA helicase RecG [Chloroflexi bacterium RBG_16_52_11]|nr:MAG: ATP-dependent DNA helicase RecG [Chloroflexi bacterium RBG_16_52_11]
MKPSLIKLHKFFKLEADRGYDNRAVVGGLDRILESWEAEARIDNLPEDIIQAIGSRLRDYPRLSESSRAEALEGLWRRLQREISDLPPLSPSTAESSQQVEREAVSKIAAAPITVQATPFIPAASEIATEPLAPQPHPEPAQPGEEPAALDASVTVLPNVGPRLAHTLGHLGIHTLRDMLYYFPRRYDDYTQLKAINRLWYGEVVTIIGTVQNVNIRPVRGGRFQVVEALVNDGTAALRVSWFNQPWVAKRLNVGAHIALSGKIDQYLGRLVMNNPEWEPLEQQQLSTNRIVPVYPLAAQITQRWMRRLMNQVVTHWAPRVRDPLPENIRRSAGLVELSTALLQIHFPDSMERLKAARHRLAFDEIFLLQLGVLRQKRSWQERTARVFTTPEEWLSDQLERLPYPLTGAQQRTLEDVRQDLASGRPMNRLLQGDVGSGKTIVAALAIAMVTCHGAQAALMAPTSILAEQHYKNLLDLFSPETDLQPGDQPPLRPNEIRLMIGATPETEKREIREELANGTIKLVIGTHALIEEPVVFADLEMTIVDEQHRFGVEQRAALRSKGTNPHLLVMTATPIPRSLALTVYGDLDLSVMDEMPPGRQEVSTFVLTPLERERAYRLVRNQIQEGRQAFIIYPLVEESEKSESKAAVEEHARLQSDIFGDFRLGLLHGRMKAEEKDEVMSLFRNGEYHILVSTSVVEVGVDVPNATVMLIEGANRFGLAQLHQFRGRVGRGGDKAYCLLVPDTSDATENERLQVMVQTNDGFVLAEKDLEQRGPGEFLGTRQSGYAAQLQLTSLTDVALIEKARRHAQALFEQDPDLEHAENRPLAEAFLRFWGEIKGDIS